MRILIVSILIFVLNLNAISQNEAERFKDEEKSYVWSRNGLNVRSGPSTKHEIVDRSKYGDEVKVISITNVSYNINGIPLANINDSGLLEPYILYGHWVKVKTLNGYIGYVISQYIINLKPSMNQSDYGPLDLDIQSIDTFFARDQIYDGEVHNSTIRYQYNNRISRVDNNGGVYGEMSISFENFTMAEVFVIMDVKGESIAMIKNWKNELHIAADHEGMCEISITKKGNKIHYYMMCSC